jgi:membrane fusion protein
MTFVAAACAILIVSFGAFATYTRRTAVSGLLVPAKGIAKIYAGSGETIKELRVKDGQHVEAGDVLYVLSADRSMQGEGSSASSSAEEALLSTVHQRQSILAMQAQQQEMLAKQQLAQATTQLSGLKSEVAAIDAQIVTQQALVASAQLQYERYLSLAQQQYIGDLAAQQRKDQWLDQQAKLQELKLSKLNMSRQIASAESDVAEIPTKEKQNLAELSRMRSEMEREGVTTKAQSSDVLVAPIGGTVTAIAGQPGQKVTNQPLLAILPKDSELEADLYAPSSAVGFIKVGQRVRMRYSAFPYQKFGQYEGVVSEISRTALVSQELPPQLAALSQQSGGEGSFRIEVKLKTQFVKVYGNRLELTPGMQLQADVMEDTRTLFEWVLEPLHSLSGAAQ